MYSSQLFNSISLFLIYLLCYLFVVVDHLFCSLFDYSFILLFNFISHQFLVLFVEKNNSDPELVFRYFDPVVPVQVHLQTHRQYEFNKHHTADSTNFVSV